MVCGVSAAILCGGCRTGGDAADESAAVRQIDRSTPHEYPPVSLDSSGREHVIVMQAPNPGWGLDLDAVEATRDGKLVYATLVMPDPERMYPQVIKTVRLGSTVPSTEPVELLVRMPDAGGPAEAPYHAAAKVD